MGAEQSHVSEESYKITCVQSLPREATVTVGSTGAVQALPPGVDEVYFRLPSSLPDHTLAVSQLLRQWPAVGAVHLYDAILRPSALRALLALRKWRVLEVQVDFTLEPGLYDGAYWEALAELFEGQHLSLCGVCQKSGLEQDLPSSVRDLGIVRRQHQALDLKTIVCPASAMANARTWVSRGFTEAIVVEKAGPSRSTLLTDFGRSVSWMRFAARSWPVTQPLDHCILDVDVAGLPLELKLHFSNNWLARWISTVRQQSRLPKDILGEIADHVFYRARAQRLRSLLV